MLGADDEDVGHKPAIAWAEVLLRPDGWHGKSGFRLLNRLTWNRLGSLRQLPESLASLSFDRVRDALPEAARYSFHAPGLDRAGAPANPAPDQTGSTA